MTATTAADWLVRNLRGWVTDADAPPAGTVEPLVRLAEVEVVSVRRECLNAITVEDIEREGVPVDLLPPGAGRWPWVCWFAAAMKCPSNTEITRIEWRYLEGNA